MVSGAGCGPKKITDPPADFEKVLHNRERQVSETGATTQPQRSTLWSQLNPSGSSMPLYRALPKDALSPTEIPLGGAVLQDGVAVSADADAYGDYGQSRRSSEHMDLVWPK